MTVIEVWLQALQKWRTDTILVNAYIYGSRRNAQLQKHILKDISTQN